MIILYYYYHLYSILSLVGLSQVFLEFSHFLGQWGGSSRWLHDGHILCQGPEVMNCLRRWHLRAWAMYITNVWMHYGQYIPPLKPWNIWWVRQEISEKQFAQPHEIISTPVFWASKRGGRGVLRMSDFSAGLWRFSETDGILVLQWNFWGGCF